MNGTILHMRQFGWRPVMVCLAIIGILAGCGPNAGVGTGGTGSLSSFISGKAADGYLVNAMVFLDKNGNYQLDEGEPFTITDSNGSYKLDVDPADVGRYPIVALAIKGVTIDKDTNQPVASSYVLSAPKESVSASADNNFISPITSQLREMMESGIYGNAQQAADALRAKMHLPAGTDMLTDYVAANDTAMHTAARNMATLMGNQTVQVFPTNGSTATVDVKRYRSMMKIIFSNMSSVKSVNSPADISSLSSSITMVLFNMPPMSAGQP